jgi:hypothetical protein
MKLIGSEWKVLTSPLFAVIVLVFGVTFLVLDRNEREDRAWDEDWARLTAGQKEQYIQALLWKEECLCRKTWGCRPRLSYVICSK